MVRAFMLAGSILFGGAATGGIAPVVAQTSTSAAPFDWSSLVGGAIGSSPAALILAWRLNKADKDNQALRAENQRLNDRAIADNKELLNRVIPIMEHASSTLKDVEQGLGQTVARANPEDVRDAVRELRDVVEDLRNRRGRDS